MRRQLYLDCDGVLADFDHRATEILGTSPEKFEKRHGLGVFWKRLATTPDFFADLPLMPNAMELYESVKGLNPIILTGLPRGSWAEPQKRRWAERHFPGVPMIATSAALKREHCHPGDVLVDDKDKYRGLWEKAGGVFVHHSSASQSIEALNALGML